MKQQNIEKFENMLKYIFSEANLEYTEEISFLAANHACLMMELKPSIFENMGFIFDKFSKLSILELKSLFDKSYYNSKPRKILEYHPKYEYFFQIWMEKNILECNEIIFDFLLSMKHDVFYKIQNMKKSAFIIYVGNLNFAIINDKFFEFAIKNFSIKNENLTDCENKSIEELSNMIKNSKNLDENLKNIIRNLLRKLANIADIDKNEIAHVLGEHIQYLEYYSNDSYLYVRVMGDKTDYYKFNNK